MKWGSLMTFIVLATSTCLAQDLKPIMLPQSEKSGGKPIMQCLNERHSSREFSREALPLQTLSNLLWSACGINRMEEDKRTAPSAMNRQGIDVYVALKEGTYLYDARVNELKPVLAGDHRGATGSQDFVSVAAVNLVYIADYSRMEDMSAENKTLYSAAEVGFIAENVYLFCASESLACVVRGWIDRDKLTKTLKLLPQQKIILAQTVGWPLK